MIKPIAHFDMHTLSPIIIDRSVPLVTQTSGSIALSM